MTQPSDVVTRRDQLTYSGVVFREFVGKLENMEFPVENGQAKTKWHFVDLKMIDTIQAYPHPACEIIMNRANKATGAVSDRGPWGMAIISSDEQGYPDITDLIGHTLHMKATERTIPADPAKKQEESMFLTWEVLSVDGEDNRPAPEEVVEATPLQIATE